MKPFLHRTLTLAACLLWWASLSSPNATATSSLAKPDRPQHSNPGRTQPTGFEQLPLLKIGTAALGLTGPFDLRDESPTRLQAPPTGSSPLRVRVIGSIRRDVYGGPGGGLIGKVEPKAVLVVVKTFKDGQLTWYGVKLESGNMYTNDDPVRSLNQGWILSIVVEPEK